MGRARGQLRKPLLSGRPVGVYVAAAPLPVATGQVYANGHGGETLTNADLRAIFK